MFEKGFESSMIKLTGTGISAMSMPALSVCRRQPADKSRLLTIFARFDNQMPMIVHHAKRQQIRPSPFDRHEKSSVQTPQNPLCLQKSVTARSSDSARDKSTHLALYSSQLQHKYDRKLPLTLILYTTFTFCFFKCIGTLQLGATQDDRYDS